MVFHLCGPLQQGCSYEREVLVDMSCLLDYIKATEACKMSFWLNYDFISYSTHKIKQIKTFDKTHSPLASSSQISKSTIRSYLQWQGPAVGLVRVVSLVAGTEREKESLSILGKAIKVCKGVYSLTGWKREICLSEERKRREIQ